MARLAAKGRRKAYATNACNRAKPIFAEARGVQNNPPRSQPFEKLAATVWIRPWRREIGQALVAPDVISKRTALRAELGNEGDREIFARWDFSSPMEAERVIHAQCCATTGKTGEKGAKARERQRAADAAVMIRG